MGSLKGAGIMDWEQIHDRLEKGGWAFGKQELLDLFRSKDLLRLGKLAHWLRLKKNGNNVYYALNRHVNYTNVCENGCLFCAFSKRKGEKGAYLLGVQEILDLIEADGNVDEVHLVGGCNPDLSLWYLTEVIRTLKNRFPHMGIKGLTAVEIAHIAKKESKSFEYVILSLKDAGLDALAGGGAEIFAEDIRHKICPNKISGEIWLNIHKIAHNCGIRSNATMLFGHIEGIEHRIDHLLKLRKLQEETAGFMSFVPIPFLPKNTKLQNTVGSTAVDILKTVAISRLALNNFPHIKAYWVMMGLSLATVALHFGADDLEGTVLSERIGKDAGGEDSGLMNEDKLVEIIKHSGFIPVRRTTLYN